MSTAIYEERDCPVCKARPQKVCADCNKPIPHESVSYSYKNMGGMGFQSHTFDHRHTKIVGGNVGFGFAKRELCLDCYRLDFAKAYPSEPLPV